MSLPSSLHPLFSSLIGAVQLFSHRHSHPCFSHPPPLPSLFGTRYTTASAAVVTMLRQRSRPYLFSNTLAPALVGSAKTVFEMLRSSSEARTQLKANTKLFRSRMGEAGFTIAGVDHPISPVRRGCREGAVEGLRRAYEHPFVLVVSVLVACFCSLLVGWHVLPLLLFMRGRGVHRGSTGLNVRELPLICVCR